MQIASRYAIAADKHFSGNANRPGSLLSIENKNLQIVKRTPDETSGYGGVDRAQGTIADVHCRLGDPVHIDQPRRLIAMPIKPRFQTLKIQRFAAEYHLPQRQPPKVGRTRAVDLDQLPKRRWSLVQYCHTFETKQIIEFFGTPAD